MQHEQEEKLAPKQALVAQQQTAECSALVGQRHVPQQQQQQQQNHQEPQLQHMQDAREYGKEEDQQQRLAQIEAEEGEERQQQLVPPGRQTHRELPQSPRPLPLHAATHKRRESHKHPEREPPLGTPAESREIQFYVRGRGGALKEAAAGGGAKQRTYLRLRKEPVHISGVDLKVPFISSVRPASAQRPAGQLSSPAFPKVAPSQPVCVHSSNKVQEHTTVTKTVEGRAAAEEEEENWPNCSRSTGLWSSNNSNWQRGAERREAREVEPTADRIDGRGGRTTGVQATDSAFRLHAAEGVFAPTTLHSKFPAGSRGVDDDADSSSKWECTARQPGAASRRPESAALPPTLVPRCIDVSCSEASSSDSESSATFSPAAQSPASPALSALASSSTRISAAARTVSAFASFTETSHASPLLGQRESFTPAAALPPPEYAAARDPCATSALLPPSCSYSRFRPRTRRTASQQAATERSRHAAARPRRNSTGGGVGSACVSSTSNGPPFGTNSFFLHPAVASPPRLFSSAAAAASPLSPASAGMPFLLSAGSSKTSPSHATTMSPSPTPLAAAVAAEKEEAEEEGTVGTAVPCRSTWGRRLNEPGDAVEIVVDNCVYRQQKVKMPARQPVALPDGEPCCRSPPLYGKQQQQDAVLNSASGNQWNGPIALPYNAREAPPSPFSRTVSIQSSSHKRSSVCEDEVEFLQVWHDKNNKADATTTIRIPPLLLPHRYSPPGLPRSMLDSVLTFADCPPPSFSSPPCRSCPNGRTSEATPYSSPYPPLSVQTCAVHKQPHTFLYPFVFAEAATQSAVPPSSPASSLFYRRPQCTAAESQHPVPTYCISNNGMGEALSYGGRSKPIKRRKSKGWWPRWLWPWRKPQHSLTTRRLQQQQQEGSPQAVAQNSAFSPPFSSRSSSAHSSSSSLSTPARSSDSFSGFPFPSPLRWGGGWGKSWKRGGSAMHPSAAVSISSASAATTSFPVEGRRRVAEPQPAPPSSDVSSCEAQEAEDIWSGGRGTFILAAVSAALEIGCVWRFPTYCFKFGGAAFLLAYVTLLLFLGVPVLALEMALGQVFRGGQMKVLNLISPRLRGLAAATLLLSFLICAYYSVFVSWTLQYLLSSIQFSLPWSVTSEEAALCAAAGHTAAACRRATLATPPLSMHAMLLLQQQLMEDYDGKQQLERGDEMRLQQALRRLGEEVKPLKKKRSSRRQRQQERQSFCAWRKPADEDTTKGICVADDKLKARTFLYTDVLGMWIKTTKQLAPAPADLPPGSDAGAVGEENEREIGSSAANEQQAGSVPADEAAGTVRRTAGDAGSRSSLRKGEDGKLSNSDLSVHSPESTAAGPESNLVVDERPRITSVSVATSFWTVTPLVAVGLAAVWMQIYLFTLRGYKPLSTFTYVTALTPIVAMALITGLALSLDGASLGMQHLVSLSPQSLSPFAASSTPKTSALTAPAKRLHAPLRRLYLSLPADYFSPSGLRTANTSPAAAAPAAGAAAADADGQFDIAAVAPDEDLLDRAAAELLPSLGAAARWLGPAAFAPPRKVAAEERGDRNKIRKSDGLLSYISSLWPSWLAVGSHALWGEAAAQVFFSLGVFQGVVTAYASHKKLTENVLLDAAGAAITNLGMSLLAAVATFAVAGHVAKGLGAVESGPLAADLSALRDVQGSQLVFVLYPLAFASLPVGVAQVTCFLCFFALLLLGLMSVVGLVQPLMGLLRRCVWAQRYPRWRFVAAACAVGFLLGLPFCTRGGLVLLEAADYRWTVVGLIFIGCCESIAFGWLYGVGRQAQCIGYLPLLLHGGTYWLAVLLAATVRFLLPPPHNGPVAAVAVGLSIAAAGVVAALWWCPWRCRRGSTSKTKGQIFLQSKQKDDQKQKQKQRQPSPEELRMQQQQQVQVQQVQQAQEQVQQQALASRKTKPQVGTPKKGRVKFNNGCVNGNSNSRQSIEGSSSGQNAASQPSHISSTNGSTAEVVNGGTTGTSSAAGHVVNSASRSASRNGIGDPITERRSADNPIADTGNQGKRTGSGMDRTSSSNSNTHAATGSVDSNTTGATRVPTGTGNGADDPSQSSSGTSAPFTSGRDTADEELAKHDVVRGSKVTASGSLDHNRNTCIAGLSSSNSSSSSNGSGSQGGRRQQQDAVLMLDAQKQCAAGKLTGEVQQQKSYRNPRGRSSRGKRGRRSFVLVKKNGEALSFTHCMFWLFVGNVEHLRKNLNAITCSGYRVLRLWPPWSVVIRYIIPTILMLLLVQELPYLFVTISRYSEPPSSTGTNGKAVAAGAVRGFAYQRQLAAVPQPHLLLPHLPANQQGPSQPRRLKQEKTKHSEPLENSEISPHSLVAVHVYTLGALVIIVGLILLGLLMPHAWDIFIPKERRKHASATASVARSSSSLRLKGFSQRFPYGPERAEAVSAPRE